MTDRKEILGENQTPEKESSKESLPDTLTSLFEERDRPASQESHREKEIKEEKENKDSSRKKISLFKKTDSETEEEIAEDKTSSSTEKKSEQGEERKESDLEKTKNELERTRKDLQANRSFGRQNAQKVKAALKAVHHLIEEGSLSEDEAQGVLASLQIEQEFEEETVQPASSHPFASIFQIVNNELVHLRKYTEDDLLEEKLKAFEYHLGTSSPEEAEELLETLQDFIEEPLKLTKKILAMGQETLESSYSDILRVGGIRNYISSLKENSENLQKKIDKLKKKLSQYEDYDRPTSRLGEMGEAETSPDADTIGSLFKERDRPMRR